MLGANDLCRFNEQCYLLRTQTRCGAKPWLILHLFGCFARFNSLREDLRIRGESNFWHVASHWRKEPSRLASRPILTATEKYSAVSATCGTPVTLTPQQVASPAIRRNGRNLFVSVFIV